MRHLGILLSTVMLAWALGSPMTATAQDQATPVNTPSEESPFVTSSAQPTILSIEVSCLAFDQLSGVVQLTDPDGVTQVGLSLQVRYKPSQHVTLWPAVASTTVLADSETLNFTFLIPDGAQGQTLRVQLTSLDGVTIDGGVFSPSVNCGPAPDPTDVPTVAPTETPAPTAIPTDTPTPSPTETLVPTVIPSQTPASTETPAPAWTPTPPLETGTLEVHLVTDDGGEIPDATLVCVDAACQQVASAVDGSIVRAFAAQASSGTMLTFTDLTPGLHQLTVSNAAPYGDATASVTIQTGTATTDTITLSRIDPTASPTIQPTESDNAIPVVNPTHPTASNQPLAPAQTTGPATSLPNTGAGQSSPDSVWILLSGIVLIALVAADVVRSRHTKHPASAAQRAISAGDQ